VIRSFLTLSALVAVLGGLVLSVEASPAEAKKPCWRQLIEDWYDGRVDGIYPARCYREAIKNSPEDLRSYSDLPSDLTRALQSARTFRRNGVTYVEPGYAGRDLEPNDDDRRSQGRGGENVPPAGNEEGPPGNRGPVPEALDNLSGDADSIPIPLIALGSLALLLIASGAAGLVARRVQARRVPRAPDA
jgi:hypothetical protein